MALRNFKNRSVDATRYAMVPRSDVPRSVFHVSSSHKTTFEAGWLVPIYVDEVLPGDSHKMRMTAFCRLGTVLFPIMDNLHLDTFFFFVPNRLVWTNWVKLMGERRDPADSISYVVPQVVSAAGGWALHSLGDFFGLPTVGQVGAGLTVSQSALPFRCYNLIWNEWFRDQTLNTKAPENVGDGPDGVGDYAMRKRCKRPDYFTTCLPWPQRAQLTSGFGTFGQASPYGIGGPVAQQFAAPVSGVGLDALFVAGGAINVYESGSSSSLVNYPNSRGLGAGNWYGRVTTAGEPDVKVTINAIRLAFQAQRFMERDARGGQRYTELLRSHFGVVSPDARLQRPEYLGGGSSPVQISPISQQSATGLTGSTTPLGHLSAIGTGVAQGHGFSGSFTEHGWIIGLAAVRADLSYQQGVHKMWHRSTKFDHYWPEFAQLGEQAVLTRELYMDGNATDITVFGFQERWAEYRSKPGMITGKFRSTATGTLDPWHLAQRFTAAPVLNTGFMDDPTKLVLERALAAGSAADLQQILFDAFFDITRIRAIPTFSVPGMVDHF